jgi:hypothetical protein
MTDFFQFKIYNKFGAFYKNFHCQTDLHVLVTALENSTLQH